MSEAEEEMTDSEGGREERSLAGDLSPPPPPPWLVDLRSEVIFLYSYYFFYIYFSHYM